MEKINIYLRKGRVSVNERDLMMLKFLSEFGNITKTADALFISQPALTSRIKQLETELGTKLVHRSNKGIRLTPTGLEAAAFADEILKKIDEFKERIQSIDDETAGNLKIAAPNIIAQYYLPNVIKEFRKFHPKARFDITVSASSKVAALMQEKKCHFGFLRNDFGWDGSERELLCTNHIAVVSMQPFELKDLPAMNRVDYSTDTYYKKLLDLWWNETFALSPKTTVHVNSLDLCKEMVFQGLGFGLLPSIFLQEKPEAHSHILKNRSGEPIERNTWLIYKKDVLNYKLAKDFFNYIKSNNFNVFLQLVKK